MPSSILYVLSQQSSPFSSTLSHFLLPLPSSSSPLLSPPPHSLPCPPLPLTLFLATTSSPLPSPSTSSSPLPSPSTSPSPLLSSSPIKSYLALSSLSPSHSFTVLTSEPPTSLSISPEFAPCPQEECGFVVPTQR